MTNLKRGARWREGAVALSQSCQPAVHPAGVSKIAVERRRHRLVLSGTNDGGLRLLDLRDLTAPPQAVVRPGCNLVGASAEEHGPGHYSQVEFAVWLPDDDRLFVSGGDTRVKVWDAKAPEECVMPVELHSTVYAGVLTKGPPAVVAVALGDNTVRLVDLRMGRPISTLQGHTQPPLCLAWGDPTINRLFSGGMDGTVRAWDTRMGARSLFVFDAYGNEPSRPLKKLLSDESLSANEAAPPRRKLDLDARIEPYRMKSMSSVFSADRGLMCSNKVFCTGSSKPVGTLAALVESSTPEGHARLSTPPQHEQEKFLREKWSEDAALRARHFVEPPRRRYEHEATAAHRGAVVAVVCAQSTSKGRFSNVLSCGVDGKVRMWDALTGRPAKKVEAFDVECKLKSRHLQLDAIGSPEEVCFVPERKNLAVYCLADGEQLCQLQAHTGEVTCVEALYGRPEVLTGGEDGRILCWKAGSPAASEAPVICLD